jgi:hypothetical protein
LGITHTETDEGHQRAFQEVVIAIEHCAPDADIAVQSAQRGELDGAQPAAVDVIFLPEQFAFHPELLGQLHAQGNARAVAIVEFRDHVAARRHRTKVIVKNPVRIIGHDDAAASGDIGSFGGLQGGADHTGGQGQAGNQTSAHGTLLR